MDDRRFGGAIRALRQRKRWRQIDLAGRAGVSATTIGRVERGRLEGIALGTVRRVAEALGARFEPTLRWQGPDLDRLLDARHAAMHAAVAGWLGALDGWIFEPEVSFSYYGERGIIDVLAWHPGRRTLLVIELESEIVDVSRLLGSMDQRRRLAWRIGRERGWDPITVSTWVVVAPSRTNQLRSRRTWRSSEASSRSMAGACDGGCATRSAGSTP